MPQHQQMNGNVELPSSQTLLTSYRNIEQRSVVRDLGERFVAALAIILCSPLLLAVAIAVKLSGPGPVLFRQERIGKDGRAFQIWKFRTMVDGADRQLEQLLVQHGRQDRPLFKVPEDPRITRIGGFLRRSSLDELPQLFNVLRGEMVFVGPRPQRAKEVALYGKREWRRLAVSPGITGLWQVSGRSTLSWDQALELDLRYVEERSVLLDLKILLRTVVVVITGHGAS